MSLPWFRMYAEFAGDPVVQSLAFEDQRHFVILLCLKCNGTLDRGISTRQREVIIVRGLGLDPVTASEVKRRLMDVGLIDKNWHPKGWDRRQFSSDLSTDRVRKYRNNKKDGNVSETDGNDVSETSASVSVSDSVSSVFSYWKEVLDHPRAVLSDDRKRKIKRALELYSVDDLKKAIDGCAVTPHNMGQNDRGEKYDDIELIVRDAKHVERFMRNADNPPIPPTQHAKPSEMQRAAAALRSANESARGYRAKPVQVSSAPVGPGATVAGSAVHDSGDGGGLTDARPDGRRRAEGE